MLSLTRKLAHFPKSLTWGFCTRTPMPRTHNPYLFLTPNQLATIVSSSMDNPNVDIQTLNNMIKMGVALSSYRWMKQLNATLVSKCIQVLAAMHQNINDQKQDDLAEVGFGQLLAIVKQSEQKSLSSNEQLLYRLYTNTYSHILPFPQQIKVYEATQNEDQESPLEYIKHVSLQKINQYAARSRLSLQEFIVYLRVFQERISSEMLNRQLEYHASAKGSELTQRQKETLAFYTVQLAGDLNLIHQLNAFPDLELSEKDSPKSICIKAEMRKHVEAGDLDLNLLEKNIHMWDYDHIIWISEFVPAGHPITPLLHQQLIKSQLPNSSSVAWLASYIQGMELSRTEHRELSRWLSEKMECRKQKEKELCYLLAAVEAKKVSSEYRQYFEKLVSLSLGNFEWESQNTIYYYGLLWGFDSEDMEYLRRYILNTYASLGTSRKNVPTHSYFYRILQIADADKFYANL